MTTDHEHQWHIDTSSPVLDTSPPQYAVFCECRARAWASWNGNNVMTIYDLRDAIDLLESFYEEGRPGEQATALQSLDLPSVSTQ